MTIQDMKESLENLYIEWFNNYLTVEKFAEHLRITETEAQHIINAGRSIHDRLAEARKVV